MKTLKQLMHLTNNEDGKYTVSWKRPDFQVESEYESSEISKEDFIKIGKLLEDSCDHTWEVTLTDKKQFNYCGKCEQCNVILRYYPPQQ